MLRLFKYIENFTTRNREFPDKNSDIFHIHYENTPIQIYWNFHLQKQKVFRQKDLIFFHISAQNIDCGFSLEPPRF